MFSKSNAVSSGSAGKDADSVTGELAAVVSLDDTDRVILGALRRCKCAVWIVTQLLASQGYLVALMGTGSPLSL